MMAPQFGKAGRKGLATEALDWLVRLRFEDPSPETLSAWMFWLEQDGAREAYDSALEAWSLGGLAEMNRPNRLELAADRYDASIPISAWLQKRRLGLRRWAPPAAAGITIAAACILGWSHWESAPSEPARVLSTLRAGREDARLSDGSLIRLGAMSAVKVDYSRHRRAVSLDRGEARFQVAHDRTRPFIVSTPLGKVTAVGTAFNINIVSNAVELLVTEGVVKVDPAFGQPGDKSTAYDNWLQIRAGQRLKIDGASRILIRSEAGTTPSRTWQDGRLEYRDEPLEAVIQDVNRYAARPIRLAEPSLGKLTYTGTVLLNSADSWVYGLIGAFPVAVREQNGSVVLTRAVVPAPVAAKSPLHPAAPAA
jgi:transmembrane sensor